MTELNGLGPVEIKVRGESSTVSNSQSVQTSCVKFKCISSVSRPSLLHRLRHFKLLRL